MNRDAPDRDPLSLFGTDPWDQYARGAPEGYLWVCLACGKTSKSAYEFNDESCALNARVYPEAALAWDKTRSRVLDIR